MSNPFEWSASSASSRLDETIARVAADTKDVRHIFTQCFFDEAREQAASVADFDDDASSLAGALVTIKDLLDVKGQVTKAGTRFMANDPEAEADADVVARLRQAGAVLLGHTNMTELAYSGLGLNPHYGTPMNALIDGAIPGGSTSGGAVSVARGLADIAIGTDTGGSLRIPAAFNGIVGFKPSQKTVSRAGCKPLSRSLDSIGPMGRSVAACAGAYRVIADQDQLQEPERALLADFVVPTNYGMDDLAPEVAAAFAACLEDLRARGYKVSELALESLEALKSLPIWQFSSIESRSDYDEVYQTKRDMMDPRVAGPTRMGRADEVDAVSYRKTLNERERLIACFAEELGNRILLMPTVPILPPSFAELEKDEDYSRLNLQVLRNPSIANVMDCCSISLPISQKGMPVGLMLTALSGSDLSLLALAETIHGS
nr:amidase family protein [uncultured Cohaesibacter sp.]